VNQLKTPWEFLALYVCFSRLPEYSEINQKEVLVADFTSELVLI
jgi:hypothetical protein